MPRFKKSDYAKWEEVASGRPDAIESLKQQELAWRAYAHLSAPSPVCELGARVLADDLWELQGNALDAEHMYREKLAAERAYKTERSNIVYLRNLVQSVMDDKGVSRAQAYDEVEEFLRGTPAPSVPRALSFPEEETLVTAFPTSPKRSKSPKRGTSRSKSPKRSKSPSRSKSPKPGPKRRSKSPKRKEPKKPKRPAADDDISFLEEQVRANTEIALYAEIASLKQQYDMVTKRVVTQENVVDIYKNAIEQDTKKLSETIDIKAQELLQSDIQIARDSLRVTLEDLDLMKLRQAELLSKWQSAYAKYNAL
jgi:hypothetical protein